MVDDNHNNEGSYCLSEEEEEIRNEDWAATCAIYGDDKTEVNEFDGGFCGTIHMSLPATTVAFFREVSRTKDDQEKRYRYFSIQRTPVLRVEFQYCYAQHNKNNATDDIYGHHTFISNSDLVEDDEYYNESDLKNMTPPHSVALKWEVYPEEWPIEEKESYLRCLADKCDHILEEEKLSFSVCEFCEHEALMIYWNVFYVDNNSNYRMILLPPKMDNLYHSNIGQLIDPQGDAKREKNSERKYENDLNKEKKQKKQAWASVDDFAKRTLLDRWKYLYTKECPICFDNVLMSEGVILPCGHFFCLDCFTMYLSMKVKDITNFRTNPFLCPLETCRQDLPIVGFVKRYISEDNMNIVRKWYKDLKNPPCFSLDRCLSPNCGAMESMRRRFHNSTQIYCEVCNVSRCELCLKRIDTDWKNSYAKHKLECDSTILLKFCERYMAASEHKKDQCRVKYPWIVSYAHFVQHDGGAISWIMENGQQCPHCKTGVERIEGCFHMKCPDCATHFCYECGEVLKPPYYGTHHCWEKTDFHL